MDIEGLFAARKDDPLYNTSYPLHRGDWQPFRVDRNLSFSTTREMAFYIHIPFCQHLCPFCEYVRMVTPSIAVQRRYVDMLRSDIFAFLARYPSVVLNGFDIGGGTPSALNDDVFHELLLLYREVVRSLPHTVDFEPSIEATFSTLSPRKVEAIAAAGIRRISLGIQSTVDHVQQCNGRINANEEEMKRKIDMLHNCGIAKVNVDLMYGLKGQTVHDVAVDLEVIRELHPEQVTLYEWRTNMLPATATASKQLLYQSYCTLYRGLREMGYNGHFGQNTFSLCVDDEGLSSYLRHRMFHFSEYKGFGIAAQSIAKEGLAYNVGKQTADIRTLLDRPSFEEEFVYLLPPQERFAKYISIAGYCGRFSLAVANGILGTDFQQTHKEALDFCLTNDYLSLHGDTLAITPRGFLYYGAVLSLFSSPLRRG